MRCYCEKHQIVCNVTCDGPYTDDAPVRFPCGCVLKKKDAQLVRVRHKQKFYLQGTGQKIKRIVPLDKPIWVIEE